ncbi:hypothetical protein [Alteribacter aurantiacus]|uniref:hypothetical protein n=1 Tax=Alteribacter aurantiacus TaxID=254410 RepID=UPI00042812D5|nr:hypothetical protein [Alteribacter aurantiacus]
MVEELPNVFEQYSSYEWERRESDDKTTIALDNRVSDTSMSNVFARYGGHDSNFYSRTKSLPFYYSKIVENRAYIAEDLTALLQSDGLDVKSRFILHSPDLKESNAQQMMEDGDVHIWTSSTNELDIVYTLSENKVYIPLTGAFLLLTAGTFAYISRKRVRPAE